MTEIEVKDLPEMRLAAVAHRGDYAAMGAAFEKLAAVLSARSRPGESQGYLRIYYDNPAITKECDLRSHAAVLWEGDDIPAELEEVVLPGGQFAVKIHEGPPSAHDTPWRAMTPEAISALGVGYRCPLAIEFYLSDPYRTSPQDLRTKLCVAVA